MLEERTGIISTTATPLPRVRSSVDEGVVTITFWLPHERGASWMSIVDYEAFYKEITRRYGRPEPGALVAVLSPLLIPIHSLDKTIIKLGGQGHYRASFTLRVTPEYEEGMQRGRTGKVVPKAYAHDGCAWREIAKG